SSRAARNPGPPGRARGETARGSARGLRRDPAAPARQRPLGPPTPGGPRRPCRAAFEGAAPRSAERSRGGRRDPEGRPARRARHLLPPRTDRCRPAAVEGRGAAPREGNAGGTTIVPLTRYGQVEGNTTIPTSCPFEMPLIT